MSETSRSIDSAETPKRALVAAVIVRGRETLLVKNIKHGGVRYEPTGGKVKPGETPEEAVVREAREELGIRVGIVRKIGVYDTNTPEGEFEVHTFECDIVEGSPQANMDPSIGGYEWVNGDRLHQINAESGVNGHPVLVPNLRSAFRDVMRMLEPPPRTE